MSDTQYDAVIVGAGIAGSIVAYELGQKGKKVLILESGPAVPPDRSDYMNTFYKAAAKTPESPYPPQTQFNAEGKLPNPAKENTPRYTVLQIGAWRDSDQCYFDYTPQEDGVTATSLNAKFAFGSSYERVGGGTTWHWLGTSLRHFPEDFELKSLYGQGVDWPGGKGFYQDLVPFYESAVKEIGVSGDKDAMVNLYKQYDVDPSGEYGTDYDFPMPGIDQTLIDQLYNSTIGSSAENTKMTYEGNPVYVSPTPQGRNSLPGERRQCAGNTNCIPICPIQAKYDGTVTLARALQTGNVDVLYQHVATNVKVDPTSGKICGIDYLKYDAHNGPATGSGTVTGKTYVLAAHAIETPKLLLMSDKNDKCPNGVANSSDQVGRNLMDHIMYLGWGLAKDPVYPYRGPLATSGFESLRDGAFRKDRAAYRIEIGNDGWQWAANDPGTTLADFVFGQNTNQLNGDSTNQQGKPLRFNPNNPPLDKLFGEELVQTLNGIYTRQIRLGYLIEQLPDPENRVELSSTLKDHLGLPRPSLTYRLASDYERNAFVSAKQITTELFDKIGATEFTRKPSPPVFSGENVTSSTFEYEHPVSPDSKELVTDTFEFYGAGHIVGTYCMGSDASNSVLNSRQQSWDHENLYMVGSGVFPTIATGNPTLTIAALSFQAAANILEDLDSNS